MMSERTGIMLAKTATPAYIARSTTWHVQCKFNGDRCRALITNGKCQLISSQGNDRNFAVPHIVDELERVFAGQTVELDGELYKHGMRHQDIRSIVSRTTERHPDYEKIEYHNFDLISSKGQTERFEMLRVLYKPALLYVSNVIIPVSTWFDVPIDNIPELLSLSMSLGYEGIILRHPYAPYERKRTWSLLKIKPTQTMRARVFAAFEERDIYGNLKGTLGSLMVESLGGSIFSVGTGPILTRQFRQENWPANALMDKLVIIKYQELSKADIPIHPVLMEVL